MNDDYFDLYERIKREESISKLGCLVVGFIAGFLICLILLVEEKKKDGTELLETENVRRETVIEESVAGQVI